MSNEPSPPAQAPQPLEDVTRADFVAVLDQLGISLVLSTRPNLVVFLVAMDGQLNCTTTLVAQPVGLAVEGGPIAVATTRTIIIFANASRLAPHYPGRRPHYDAFFVPRVVYFTGDCAMHDMVFSGRAIIGASTKFS